MPRLERPASASLLDLRKDWRAIGQRPPPWPPDAPSTITTSTTHVQFPAPPVETIIEAIRQLRMHRGTQEKEPQKMHERRPMPLPMTNHRTSYGALRGGYARPPRAKAPTGAAPYPSDAPSAIITSASHEAFPRHGVSVKPPAPFEPPVNAPFFSSKDFCSTPYGTPDDPRGIFHSISSTAFTPARGNQRRQPIVPKGNQGQPYTLNEAPDVRRPSTTKDAYPRYDPSESREAFRRPVLPKRNRPFLVSSDDPGRVVMRSTSKDAFVAYPYQRPMQPIRPFGE